MRWGCRDGAGVGLMPLGSRDVGGLRWGCLVRGVFGAVYSGCDSFSGLAITMRRYLPFLMLIGLVGCGGADDASTVGGDDPDVADSTGVAGTAGTGEVSASDPGTPKKRTFKPLSLGGDNAGASSDAMSTVMSEAEKIDAVIDQLKPLQVLLGSWRGTTRREFDGFKAVDEHEWVWDLQSDPKQPALVMSWGGESPYVKEARMTWLADSEQYTMTITAPADEQRVFVGEFAREVEDVPGDDGKLQRTFALRFTQTEPADAKEQFQYTFNQQENNRYLMEIDKKRGKAKFRRYDTVSTQREGTSFALSDSDYGEKTCIISAGLGTTQVSYQGRTYWVCCSGCKAAFEEDPERWIKRAAEEKKKAE